MVDVAVVVVGVFVENNLAEFLEGELGARPDLGHVKGVERALFGLDGGHGLVVGGPWER